MIKPTDEELVKLAQIKNSNKAMIELLNRYRPLILSKVSTLKSFHSGSILMHDDILRILEFTFCKLIPLFPSENKEMYFSGWISKRLLNRSIRHDGSYNKTKNMFKREMFAYDDSLIPSKKELYEDEIFSETLEKYNSLINLIINNGHKNFSKTELKILKCMINNKTLNQIALEINCDKSNVYKILYNARCKLKNILQQ